MLPTKRGLDLKPRVSQLSAWQHFIGKIWVLRMLLILIVIIDLISFT